MSCFAFSSHCILRNGVSCQNVCPVLSDRDPGASGTDVSVICLRDLFEHLGLNPSQIYTFTIVFFAFSSHLLLRGGVSPQSVCCVLSDRDFRESGTDLSVICFRDLFEHLKKHLLYKLIKLNIQAPWSTQAFGQREIKKQMAIKTLTKDKLATRKK